MLSDVPMYLQVARVFVNTKARVSICVPKHEGAKRREEDEGDARGAHHTSLLLTVRVFIRTS